MLGLLHYFGRAELLADGNAGAKGERMNTTCQRHAREGNACRARRSMRRAGLARSSSSRLKAERPIELMR